MASINPNHDPGITVTFSNDTVYTDPQYPTYYTQSYPSAASFNIEQERHDRVMGQLQNLNECFLNVLEELNSVGDRITAIEERIEKFEQHMVFLEEKIDLID